MEDSDKTASTDRSFVTALARGLEILGCFRREERYLSNIEIARRTGLAKPTVTRLTYTLTKTGHLSRNANSGEYRLSPKVLQLGFSVLSSLSINERFMPEMEELARGPNPYVSVALGERSGTRVVYVAAQQSQQLVSMSIVVGSRLPLFYSGIGRAVIVGMDEAARELVVSQGIEEFPDQRVRIEQSVQEALRDYDNLGYCTSFGGWKREINSIAAPVHALDGSTVYGINIGGPSFMVSPTELETQYAPHLIETVKSLSSK